MSFVDPITYFPFLDDEQFCLASHSLHSDYIKAILGKQRRSFKLGLHRSFTAEGRSYDWISILKILDTPIPDEAPAIIDLTTSIENLGWYGEGGMDGILMDVDAENADFEALRLRVVGRKAPNIATASMASPFMVALPMLFPSTITPPMRHPSIANPPVVVPSTITPPTPTSPMASGSMQVSKPEVLYEIHMHSTYRVPTLWFSLNHLPKGHLPWNIESVMKYLVPPSERENVRKSQSTVISMAQHPITDLPAWFVHPCNTSEALRPFKNVARIHNYLRLWIGQVGNPLGLCLPSAMIPPEDQN